MSYKRQSGYVLVTIAVILSTHLCSNAFAASASGECSCDIYYGVSDGTTVNAESYSIVSPIDDYQTDSGSDVLAQTNVNIASGVASSFADSPYYLSSYAVVSAEAEAYAMDQTWAWAELRGTGITAYATDTVLVGVGATYELDLPSGSGGHVQFYVGLYEGSQPGSNLLLTPQGDWSQTNIGSISDPFYVLSATYNSGSINDVIEWNIPVVQGTEYSFYSFVEANADVVPEPVTLLLLGLGALILRKKHR